jgi:glycosyltransferase involved in cell wall biosynthesis
MINKPENNNKPRILMIAPVFYPYPPIWPEGMVNAKLALAMKRAGWHIDIIIAGYSNGAGRRYPSEETGWKELVNNVHIINLAQRRTLPHKLLDTMKGFVLTGQILRRLGWGLSVLNAAKKLNSMFKYDVILSRAIPDYAHFAALLVHRQTRVPWIANWNDPTPNHKFPVPHGEGPDSPIAPDIFRWYQAICKHCTWHIFPCERLRDYMCSYLPGQIKTKSSVIPHVAMENFSIAPVSHDGFSICYAGSISPPREVTAFLEGIKRFKKILDSEDSFCVRFLVDKPDIAAESARTMGVEDVIRIEAAVPYSQMPEMLAKSDVLAIIEAPVKEGIFMPAKIVDYVQIDRPILALTPVVGTISDIFSKHGGGIAVDCQSPDAVAQALQTFYVHWKEGTLNQKYGSNSLISLFSEERILRLYMSLFKKLRIIPAH